jgi:hypothetical protein
MTTERESEPLLEEKGWEAQWQRPLDNYGLLLVMILLTFAAYTLLDPGRWPNLVLTVIVSATLILAFRTSKAAPLWTRTVAIVSLLAVVVNFVIAAGDPTEFADNLAVLWLILALPAPWIVLRRIGRHDHVDQVTLGGAVCVFLLIGMIFTFAFQTTQELSGDPFFGGPLSGSPADFAYFSLVTITTLGYGDLAPLGDVGRFLAATEAVIGTLYLVTVLALIVARFQGVRRTPRRRDRIRQRADAAGDDSPDDGADP